MSTIDRRVECDIDRDRNWTGQYHCKLHGCWFRDDDDDDPALCPAGEQYENGFDAGIAIGRRHGLNEAQEQVKAGYENGYAAGKRDGIAIGRAEGAEQERAALLVLWKAMHEGASEDYRRTGSSVAFVRAERAIDQRLRAAHIPDQEPADE